MRKLLGLAIALLTLAAFAVPPVLAGSDTATFQVSANVIPSCKFTATTPMDFGNLDVPKAQTGTPLPATSTLTVLCTKDGTYSIDLDNGTSHDATGLRKMQDGSGNALTYDIFIDGDHTTRWGVGTGNNVPFTGDGVADTFTAYGQLPWSVSLLPSTPVGSYVDTITASVNF